MKVTFRSPDVPERVVDALGGLTLMEAAVQAGIDEIEAQCGGGMSCATCHVYIAEEWRGRTGEASEMENELLEGADYRTGASRLSCQITLTEEMDGLVVYLPGPDHAARFNGG